MKKLIMLACSLLAVLMLDAQVRLPEMIGDNMVLQQQSNVALWGWGEAGKTVTVTNSWSDKSTTTEIGRDGSWKLQISTPAGSFTPQTVTISDGTPVTLNNVLIGEVWMMSGQSNMELVMRGVDGANEQIALANRYKDRIHILTVEPSGGYEPQQEVKGKWETCNPNSLPKFSAVGYFFAKNLYQALDVPVGVISCSLGGCKLEAFMPKDILSGPGFDDIDVSSKEAVEKVGLWERVLELYNGMICPIKNYTLKGFAWYQGESNIDRRNSYASRLAQMVTRWRSDWGLGDLPFYIIEIAPYGGYGEDNINAAIFREVQYKASKSIANCGFVTTNDLVKPSEYRNIHPTNKHDVGLRLCYLALHDTYGFETVECSGPTFSSAEFKDGKAFVTFDHAMGMNVSDDIVGFEVCGADKVFHPAKISMSREWGGFGKPIKYVVSSSEVSEPIAVRYCFKNWSVGNLKNSAGLAAIPFRTDDFE